ncbi:MAG: hypothetical protein HN390_01760 [Anaerolineae bacterium]|nr:hypothetical protein [Anaerolineae bacterium]
MKKRGKSLLIALAFVVALWLLISYSSGPARTRKPSTDWGRGVPVGADASGTLGMVVEDDGSAIHLVWPFEADAGKTGIRYVQLGESARVVEEKDVVQIQGEMRAPRIFMTQQNSLRLLWATRVDSSQKWQLWYAEIDLEGTLQTEPKMLSDASFGVRRFEAVGDSDGGFWVVWDDTNSGSIHLTGVSADGQKQAQITSVAEKGSNPSIALGADDQIHLSWLNNNNDLIYAELDAGFAHTPENIHHIALGTGASLNGPRMGISDEQVYIFWSILDQSGLEAGTARTEFVSFPLGVPEEVSSQDDIWVLPYEEPLFQPKDGGYSYSELVPASLINRTTPFVYAPSLIQNPRGEMALALAAQQQHRLDGYVQIAVAFMENGIYKGYSFATKTQEISGDPVLAADADGNIHLVWREGFDKEAVYYTTMDPEIRAIIDRPTLRDASTLILASGLESMTGILLFPLAFPWLFPGLVLVVIWRLVKNDENISFRSSQIVLMVSLILYQGSKILVFPTFVDYTPFSAWIDIADGWGTPLRIIVPFIIFAIAIFFSERFRRRGKGVPSTLRYYFVTALVDMLLTLAIYGVNFLGAY